jgi:hypothetical protein
MSIGTWGPITWYLFHTLAEKIQEKHFNEEKDGIINIIKLICNSLPCPECKAHAQLKLRSVNFNNIKTKENLKTFLFEFHNMVNRQKNKPPFHREELDKKYKLAKLPNILRQFIIIFKKPSGNINVALSNALPKERAITELIEWYKKSYYKFNI